MIDEQGKWITTKEAAEIIGVTTRHVLNMIEKGDLKSRPMNIKGSIHLVLESSARAAKRKRKPKKNKP